MVTSAFSLCDVADVSSNTNFWLLTSIKDDVTPTLYPVTPLNPRTQPVNELVVIPVYVMISSPIFKRPYSEGKPFVDDTPIPVSEDVISAVNIVEPVITSGTRLSTLR